MMHPALLKLIRLQVRGFFRRSLRGAGTPARIVFFVIGILLIASWLSANLANALMSKRSLPGRVRLVMPLAVLGFCLASVVTSMGDKAMSFTAGEVDQLFPGPFSRRDLLAFKLLKSSLLALLTGLIFSLVILRHAQWWPACFVGVYLSLIFVQLFSVAAVMMGQTIGAAAYSRARKVVFACAAIAALVIAQRSLSTGAATLSVEQVAQQVNASAVGRVVLAPLQPFGNAMTATSLSELAKWAVYSVFLIAVMLALVIVLDANYLETALVNSQRRYQKIQQLRGGSFLSGVGVKQAKWQLPALPWARGAGPVAWRQLTNAIRSSRGLLLLLGTLCMVAVLMSKFIPHNEKVLLRLGAAMGVWLTFLLSGMLNFDFRGDVDRMDVLKSLPIPSVALTVGQLVAPVAVMSVLHLLVLAGLTFIVPGRRVLVCAAFLVLPVNTLLFCAENLVFLLFPHRPAAASPGDLQVLGKKFVFLLMKGAVLTIGGGFAGGVALLVWVISGKSLAAMTLTASLILAAECGALLPVIAWAFRKFDPSIDTPA